MRLAKRHPFPVHKVICLIEVRRGIDPAMVKYR
jgi:hypothetical protein